MQQQEAVSSMQHAATVSSKPYAICSNRRKWLILQKKGKHYEVDRESEESLFFRVL